jgi:cysteinyl-tRNA synthetase
MSMKLLGEHFDIHGGGLDLVFPHHENEVVQSESYSGQPFATFWLHNGLLTKEGKKISKSDPDTVVLMNDLLKKYDPDTLRALFIASHYRRPTDYGTGRLDEISRGLEAFWSLFGRFERLTGESFFTLEAPTRKDDARPASTIEEVDDHRTRFLEAMDDDFNTGGALGELYEMIRALNRFADAHKLESSADPASLATYRSGVVVLKELTQILGLFRHPKAKPELAGDTLTPKLLDLLVKLRTRVRKEKNFGLADDIRKELAELGVILEDRPDGTHWKTDSGLKM